MGQPEGGLLHTILEESEANMPANAARLASLGADAAKLWDAMRALVHLDDAARIDEIRALSRRVETHPSARDDAGKALRMLARHTSETLESFLHRLAHEERPSSTFVPQPMVTDRAHVVLASRQLLEVLPNGNRGPGLALERGLPTATCRTSTGLYLAFGDGTIQCFHDNGRQLVQTAEAREPCQWTALAEVRRGGERLLAALDTRGAVHLWRIDLGEVVALFATGTVPVAMTADGEALVVCAAEGPLRRFRTVAPDAPEPFPSAADASGFVALDRAGGGALAAVTATGQAVFYDGRDPHDPPWTWQPKGHRAVRVVPADEHSAIAVDDEGGLWLVGPRSRQATSLSFRLGPGLVGLSRMGRWLFAGTRDGALHVMSLTAEGTLGPPQRFSLGEPISALL